MSESEKHLGRLVGVYAIAPAHLQRAVFVAVLSFMFFVAMMFAFYLRQNFVYFLLATAFLLVYLVTMVSWVMQRRRFVRIFENGVAYRKFACAWDELASVEHVDSKTTFGLAIKTKSGRQITIPSSIRGIDEIERLIRDRISS